MEVKLIKMVDGYTLSVTGSVDDLYGISNHQLAEEHHLQKLSLKNCEAIENGYDLDELAEQNWRIGLEECIPTPATHVTSFKAGFKKALEILGGKKFSINEVVELSKILISNPIERCGKTPQELVDAYVKSLQQTEWDVEIEMEVINEQFSPGATCIADSDYITVTKAPKLDADSCLILKRK